MLSLLQTPLANDNGLAKVRSIPSPRPRPALVAHAQALAAQTPPMGWRSWNLYGANVNQTLIEGIMDGMVRKDWLRVKRPGCSQPRHPRCCPVP